MAAGCYSDHLLLLKAWSGWREVMGKGEGEEYDYLRQNFLHRGSLRMIEGEKQLLLINRFLLLNHIKSFIKFIKNGSFHKLS